MWHHLLLAARPHPPTNLSAQATHNAVTLHWRPHTIGADAHKVTQTPASPPTHYTIKWAEKDAERLQWLPGYIRARDGPLNATVGNLDPHTTYAARVAAVNEDGAAWSELVVFSTLSHVQCDDIWHWQAILEQVDEDDICSAASASRTFFDPHPTPCTSSKVEYVIAGISAAVTLVVLVGAILSQTMCPETFTDALARRRRSRRLTATRNRRSFELSDRWTSSDSLSSPPRGSVGRKHALGGVQRPNGRASPALATRSGADDELRGCLRSEGEAELEATAVPTAAARAPAPSDGVGARPHRSGGATPAVTPQTSWREPSAVGDVERGSGRSASRFDGDGVVE